MYIPPMEYSAGIAMADHSKAFGYQPPDYYQGIFQDKSYIGQYVSVNKGGNLHGQM